MKNKKLLIKIIAGVLAVITLGTVKIGYDKNTKKHKKLEDNYAVTTLSDNILTMFTKKDDGIAVLPVGDHKKTNTNFQNTKLRYLEKNNVNTAIIINCDTTELSDIYKDVDYVKSVLSEHKIELPVYIDIDKIMDNMDINNNAKKELICSFLEKCDSNRIYVGVCGTDTNLCRLKEYVFQNITNYDALVRMDKEEIKYDGPFNMYETMDGFYILKSDLSSIIREKNLNDAERFANDATYTYTTKDEFEEKLYLSGLSRKELKKYNSQIFLNEGDILKIPSIICTDSKSDSILGYTKANTPLIGCDISSNQENGDWDELSENMDFVIIRTSTGEEKDSKYDEYYKKCIDHDILVGVYTMINYTSIGCPNLDLFKQNQSKTSNKTLELLKNKKIDLPVYIDIENPYFGDTKYARCHPRELFPKEYIQYMLEDWYNKMSDAGYIPGIYANKEYIDYISKCVDYELSDKFQVWIAGGPEYKEEQIYSEYEMPEELIGYKGSTLYQVTDSAIGAGIGNHNGNLDINISEVDFSKPLYSDSELENDEIEIREFNRINTDLIAAGVLGAMSGATGVVLVNNKKRKRKYKQKNCK